VCGHRSSVPLQSNALSFSAASIDRPPGRRLATGRDYFAESTLFDVALLYTELRDDSLSPTINYKKIFVFGFYNLSYGMTDAEGQPADPYNLRLEWGPSSFADVRHRFVVGPNLPLPLRFSISPFIIVQSARPMPSRPAAIRTARALRPRVGRSSAGLRLRIALGGSTGWTSPFGCSI
jgi:hypothetical protein